MHCNLRHFNVNQSQQTAYNDNNEEHRKPSLQARPWTPIEFRPNVWCELCQKTTQFTSVSSQQTQMMSILSSDSMSFTTNNTTSSPSLSCTATDIITLLIRHSFNFLISAAVIYLTSLSFYTFHLVPCFQFYWHSSAQTSLDISKQNHYVNLSTSYIYGRGMYRRRHFLSTITVNYD